jgi:long-chain acyl-CoA synthetase
VAPHRRNEQEAPVHDRPWLNSYDPGVPATLEPYGEGTILDAVRRHAHERPNAVALRFEGATTAYGPLVRQAEAFASALRRRGVARGERLALILPNCPQFVVAELGAWSIGAAIAPLNPTYPEDELAALLERSGAGVAVVLSPFYETLKRVQPRTAVRRVLVARVRDALPFPRSALFRLFREKRGGHAVAVRAPDELMADVLAAHAGEQLPPADLHAGDPAVLLPSGGTTGTPKCVVGSHRGFAAAGRQLAAWLDAVLRDGDILLLPLPLFHVYGCVGVQALAFVRGLALSLVANPRDTKGLLATIRRDRPAFITAVPTLLTAIMSHPDAAKMPEAFRGIRLCFSGAAPLLAETRRRFEELTGGVVVEGYSLTEAQMATIANPALGEKKLGSIGLPLPDVDLRIVDTAAGTPDVARGEAGELLLSAPQLMLGYWPEAEETAEVLRPDADGRRWLHTGDVGFIDPDGYVFLTDRKKDLIKVSGYQVWPREVEEVIIAHPAVLEVGVTGIISDVKGEVPAAWVVLRPGASPTPAEIRAFCRERLAPYKVPAKVTFVKELPKSAIGKVLRRKLRELDASPPETPAESTA